MQISRQAYGVISSEPPQINDRGQAALTLQDQTGEDSIWLTDRNGKGLGRWAARLGDWRIRLVGGNNRKGWMAVTGSAHGRNGALLISPR